MTAKTIIVAGLSVIAMAAQAAAVQAHDPMTGKALPAKYLERLKPLYEAREALAGANAPRGIFSPIFQWGKAYNKLRVCFFDGSQEVRKAVAEVASEWESPTTGIKFDWGKKSYRTCSTKLKLLPHIRISFDQPGNFSMLGTASVHYVKLEEATLNLEGMDKLKPEEIKSGRAAGTIRHEFGHALGLDHEHQSPRATCEKDFNWDKIYETWGTGEEAWTKEMIDDNMRILMDPDAMMSDYDPKSVMKYTFPAEFFTTGKNSPCYTEGENDKISDVDRQTIAFMYPADAVASAKAEAARRDGLKAAAAAKIPGRAGKALKRHAGYQ